MSAPPVEYVVLVDDDDQPLGTAEKATVHHGQTPLHRGFSVFLFDRSGHLLLQQRSLGKRTWPGVWSNSCCGHPQPEESTVAAMQRRIRDELGLAHVQVQIVLPGYRYRYEHDGVVENELCPVAVGVIDEHPHPNPDEVHAVRWIAWENFLREIDGSSRYSEWCIEEARLLADDETFRSFYRGLSSQE